MRDNSTVSTPGTTASTGFNQFVSTPSTTATTASYSPLQATGTVYKPWNELDEDAKITTSAAAKKVRDCRFPRDTTGNDPSFSVQTHQDAHQLVGEIYDAMISVDRALDDPQQWAIRSFTMSSEQGPRFPSVPQKSVVASAYWAVSLIIDGYKNGFRTVLQSGSQYEYQGWPQRKAALLEVLKTRKASVVAILSPIEVSVWALIFDPRAWDAARPIAHPKQDGPPLMAVCRPFATLTDSDIPKSAQEIAKYRVEMHGERKRVEPYLLDNLFVREEWWRAFWVRLAYRAFVTPEDPKICDDHSLLSSIEHFLKRKAWSESYIVAMLWKIADILEDGARHGFIRMPKPNFLACNREYESDSSFELKLHCTHAALVGDKALCAQIMERGWHSIVELVEAPEAVFKSKSITSKIQGEAMPNQNLRWVRPAEPISFSLEDLQGFQGYNNIFDEDSVPYPDPPDEPRLVGGGTEISRGIGKRDRFPEQNEGELDAAGRPTKKAKES